MPAPPLPEALRALVAAHGSTYAPRYSQASLSDHGPMAYLAPHCLGIGERRIQQFAAQDQQRLTPLGRPSQQLDAGN